MDFYCLVVFAETYLTLSFLVVSSTVLELKRESDAAWIIVICVTIARLRRVTFACMLQKVEKSLEVKKKRFRAWRFYCWLKITAQQELL